MNAYSIYEYMGALVCICATPSFVFFFLLNVSEDESKVGLLKSLPNADTNLLLFDADIYNPNDFKPAIEGCEFVFHLATPMQHTSQSSQVSFLMTKLLTSMYWNLRT